MALKIVPSAEVGEENPLVTIFGEPDAGKTSLAYTACERNRLLLIDFDGKAQRSLRVGDEPTARVTSWEDVQGVAPSDLDGFHVVVLDSVTEAIEKAKRHVLKANPRNRTKSGTPTPQGWTALGDALRNFVETIRDCGKQVVLIAHLDEVDVNGATEWRIKGVGSALDYVVIQSDAIGFLCKADRGDSVGRLLSFAPRVGCWTKTIPDGIEDRWVENTVCKPLQLKRVLDEIRGKLVASDRKRWQETERLETYRKAYAELRTVEEFQEVLDRNRDTLDTQLKTALWAAAMKAGLSFDRPAGKFFDPRTR